MIGTYSCMRKSKKWTKKWLSISLKDSWMLTFYMQSKAAERHYWDSSLIVSMFYLLHLLLSPLPLQLLIVSLVATFQSSSPQHRASSIHRSNVLCAPATKKKRKPIPIWGLCTQARTLSSTLLQNLPHWRRLNLEKTQVVCTGSISHAVLGKGLALVGVIISLNMSCINWLVLLTLAIRHLVKFTLECQAFSTSVSYFKWSL